MFEAFLEILNLLLSTIEFALKLRSRIVIPAVFSQFLEFLVAGIDSSVLLAQGGLQVLNIITELVNFVRLLTLGLSQFVSEFSELIVPRFDFLPHKVHFALDLLIGLPSSGSLAHLHELLSIIFQVAFGLQHAFLVSGDIALHRQSCDLELSVFPESRSVVFRAGFF